MKRSLDQRALVTGIAAVATLGFGYYSSRTRIPLINKHRSVLLPLGVRSAIGSMSVRLLEKQSNGRLYRGHPIESIVRTVFMKLLYGCKEEFEQLGWNWELVVLDDNVINAACADGGKLVVYRGLVEFLASTIRDPKEFEATLAFVIAHEIGHAVGYHHASSLSVLSLLIKLFIDPTYQYVMHLLLQLPLARSRELEADLLGLMIMSKACYNPKMSKRFFDLMSQHSKNSDVLLTFLSTHPSDKDRLEQLESNLHRAQSLTPPRHKCPPAVQHLAQEIRKAYGHL